MTNMPRVLALAACLRGETPAIRDWDGVVALANRAWLTPQLFVAMAESGMLSALPADVRSFLGFIQARNLKRNESLRRQLREAVQALNKCGIEPTLLKGAIGLCDDSDKSRLGARIIADLDLLVPVPERPAALEALAKLGYARLDNSDGLARPTDVGAIEVHRWPSDNPLYSSLAGIEAGAVCPAFGTLRVRVPPAHLRVLHLVLHDQVKEGDYWRGRVDLRHLYDIARIASGGIDWGALRTTARLGLERDALEGMLMMATHLFGTEVPPCREMTRAQRLRHWCRVAQLRHPVATAPLRLIGDAAWVRRRIRRREMNEWAGWRAAPRTLRKTIRMPALAYRALTGITQGPKT